MTLKTTLGVVAVGVVCLAGVAQGADGPAVYKATCGACHDSGAGLAPRITHPEEWQPRWQRGRAAMHEAAIKGVPNSAMAAKGGYAHLSDDDVKAAVDYMLARAGYQDRPAAKPGPGMPAMRG